MLLRHGSGRTFVAVPCYGQMPAASAFGLFSLAKQDCEIVCLVGNCHVDDARNFLVSVFLETDCEQLLFVDADTWCEAWTWERFLAFDDPVVGAAIPKKNDRTEYAVNVNPGPVWADDRGLIEVFDCGTGVLKIQRHVLERLFDLSTKYQHDHRSVAEIFNRAIVDGARLSGDLNFCRKWRELGGSIYVDPEMRVAHTGEKTWSGTFGSYLRARNGLALSYGIERIKSGVFIRNDVIDMWEEWGNDFSASHELLVSCIEIARQVKRPIIEIGSGLTSLCMAATGAEVHALEHDPVWLEKTMEAKNRLGLDSLTVHYAPLVNYPDGRWYRDSPLPWGSAQVVICDGPPRQLGNRYVLYSVMQEKGCNPGLVIQDDMDRAKDIDALPERFSFEIMGKLRRFAVGRPVEMRAVSGQN